MLYKNQSLEKGNIFMRTIWGLLVLCLFSMSIHAQTAYLDIDYSSTTIRPEKQSRFSKLFNERDNHVAMVVTLIKETDASNYTIISPATHVSTFTQNANGIRETKNTNKPLITRTPIYSHEHISLKIEFFSLNKDKLTSLSNGIANLAEVFATAPSPQLAPLINSAKNNFISFLTNNKDIYVETNASLKSNETGSYKFMFDGDGEETKDISKAVASLNLQVTSQTNYEVSWDAPWIEQANITDVEKQIFQRLVSSTGHANKKKQCEELEREFLKRIPQTASNDLLAIAINSADWPQDDTINNRCMKLERAKDYKSDHDFLVGLISCNSDECIKSKQMINRWRDGSSARILNVTLGGGVDITDKNLSSCYSNISKLISWKDWTYSEDIDLFSADTSVLDNEGNKLTLKQQFFWENGTLKEHTCI